MKVSIITVVYNNKTYIEDCIRSVLSQTYKDIEHIIIDGGSADGTLDVIKQYKDKISKVISEPDNGIYDALNKGIRLASGNIVGFLHADDIYANDKVIDKVAYVFMKNSIDSCYGDLQYVKKDNINRVIRHWKSSEYEYRKFKYGWMPPHPTLFVKREIYDKYGSFNTEYKIAADYELMLRLLWKYKISTHYIPEVLIKMRIGGASNKSLKNLIRKSSEDYKAIKNYNAGGIYTLFLKNLSKIPQFFIRSKN